MISYNFIEIEIRRLLVEDLPELIDLWNKDPEGYNQHFIPFEMNDKTLINMLNNAVKDIYFAVRVKHNLAGFFMIRGFDAGYQVPSYGVWISSQFKNKGLAKLTLQYTISLCRINNVERIMLKVHPDNKIAQNIYKNFGFIETGIDEKIGHIIMHKDLA